MQRKTPFAHRISSVRERQEELKRYRDQKNNTQIDCFESCWQLTLLLIIVTGVTSIASWSICKLTNFL